MGFFDFLKPVERTAKKVGTGVGLGAVRSLTGTAQGAAGLFDLATPGKGTSRVSKKLDSAAKTIDSTSKDEGAGASYKAGQVGTDVLSFLAGSGLAKAAGKTEAVASKIAPVSKATAPISKASDKVATKLAEKGVGGKVASATYKGAVNPANNAANVLMTANYTGQNASKGRDTNPAEVVKNLGLGTALNVGAPLIGALAKASTSSEVKKLLKDLPSNVRDKVAPHIAKSNDTNVVRNILEGGQSKIVKPPEVTIPKVEKPQAPPAAPTQEELAKPHIDAVEQKIKTQKELNKAAPNDTARAKGEAKLRQLIRDKQALHDSVAPEKPLKINNPDGANVDGFKINNGTGAPLIEQPKPGFQINNPYKDLEIKNNSGGPLVGEGIHGAAQQAHEGKSVVTNPKPPENIFGQDGKAWQDYNKRYSGVDMHTAKTQAEFDAVSRGDPKMFSKTPDAKRLEDTIAGTKRVGYVDNQEYNGLFAKKAREAGLYTKEWNGVTLAGKNKADVEAYARGAGKESGKTEHYYIGNNHDSYLPKGKTTTNVFGEEVPNTTGTPQAGGIPIGRILGIKDKKPPANPAAVVPERSLVDSSLKSTTPSKALEGEVLPGPSKDPVENVVAALRGQPAAQGQTAVKGVVSSIADNRSALQQARRERLARATTAGEGLTGREKSVAERGALKGEIPKVDASNLQEHLQKTVHPDDVHAIAKLIDESKDLQGYDKINAKAALYNLFDNGKVPRPNEWKKINTVLGSKDLEETVSRTAKLYGKAVSAVRAVAGTPKAILSSFDLSGMGRQGMFLGTRYPQEFAKSFKKQAEYLASPKNYEAAMKARAEHPNTQFYDKMKLALTGVKEFAHGEEAFPRSLAESKVAEKLLVGKGVEASNRAYTGALSEFRGNVADRIIQDLKDSGAIEKMTDKDWKSLGRYINTASGRGTLKYTESAAQVLGDALFSPRLWKSRLDTLNPKYYYDLKGPARKLALQNAGTLASAVSAVLGLAVLAGGKVETDARSSDFLKVKFGDTRVDLLGGLQQNLVFAWRELSAQKKSSTTGAVTSLTSGKPLNPTRLSVLADLVANKEAPLPAEASRLLTGHDKSGNKLTIKGELGNSLVPLSLQETASEIKHYGAKGAISSLPGYLGAGEQTYGLKDVRITDKQKEFIGKISDPKKREAYTAFAQTFKIASGTKANARDAIKEAIRSGDNAKASKLAKAYNKSYSEAFEDVRKKYGKYRHDDVLAKKFSSGQISEDLFNKWVKDGGK